jgi:predicted HD superfamily hydrolase involved in NAD metabolism
MHPYLAALAETVTWTGDASADVTALLAYHGRADTIGHSMRVAAEAKRLALHWGEDAAGAETAGWLHDVSAIVPVEERIGLAEDLGLEVLPEERAFPMIMHQKLSAAIAQAVFGITDPAILSAIGCHTTLKAGASRLDKIVFVADKMQWDQAGDAPYLRAITGAVERSLDQAVLVYLDYLWQQRATLPVVHPWVVQAYHQTLNKLRTPDAGDRYPGFSGSPSSRSSSSRNVETIISSAGSRPGT